MKTFQQIKNDAVREFCTNYTRNFYSMEMVQNFHIAALKQIIEGTYKGTRPLITEIEDKCVEAIMRTDIRCFRDLMEVCPKSFPAYVRSGNFALEYGDNGFYFENLNATAE